MTKVLVAEKIAAAGIALLLEKFEVDVKTDLTPEQLVEQIPAYDALIVRSATQASREVIEAGRNLKIIGRAGVGVDNVDVDAATRRGIVVANAPEATVVSAAEQTIGLLVALARNIPQAHAALKQGAWERSRWRVSPASRRRRRGKRGWHWHAVSRSRSRSSSSSGTTRWARTASR